jgi:hypothetical protein
MDFEIRLRLLESCIPKDQKTEKISLFRKIKNIQEKVSQLKNNSKEVNSCLEKFNSLASLLNSKDLFSPSFLHSSEKAEIILMNENKLLEIKSQLAEIYVLQEFLSEFPSTMDHKKDVDLITKNLVEQKKNSEIIESKTLSLVENNAKLIEKLSQDFFLMYKGKV